MSNDTKTRLKKNERIHTLQMALLLGENQIMAAHCLSQPIKLQNIFGFFFFHVNFLKTMDEISGWDVRLLFSYYLKRNDGSDL